MSAQQIPLTQEMELYKKPAQAMTPMDLLHIATQNNQGIDIIERLAALQERTMNRQSEIEFNDAMNAVQSELGRVAPDLNNPQTHSKYASYATLDRVIRPLYIKHGLSLSFDTADAPHPDTVRVVCYVSKGGHTRRYQVDMPADGKGAKGGDVMTKTHAAGSAMSYGMRYLLKAIFNVAIGEDDNDGNGAHFSELSEHLEWIANCRSIEELQRVYRNALEKAKAAKDTNAMKTIAAAKDKRKAELS